MKITITADDESDRVLLDNFAAATGWTRESGIAKRGWVAEKVVAYVAAEARRGFSFTATRPTRDAYIVQAKAAAIAARTAVVPPTVEVVDGIAATPR